MSLDVYLQGVAGATRGECVSFGDQGSPTGVRGPNKLVSRFLKCLLTLKGSSLLDVDYGTYFPQLIGGNVDRFSVSQLVSEAVVDASEKLKEYQAEYALDDDEALDDVEILDIQWGTDGSGVSVRLRVNNVAGETATFIITQAGA